MSHLHIVLAIDDQATAERWKAAIAFSLQALADQVASSRGPLEVRQDWPDLESWPQVIDTWPGPAQLRRTIRVTLTDAQFTALQMAADEAAEDSPARDAMYALENAWAVTAPLSGVPGVASSPRGDALDGRREQWVAEHPPPQPREGGQF